MNYGGSRQQAEFFERHGHSVVFNPLPSAVIFHSILSPIFTGTLLEENAQVLSAELVKAYQQLVSFSEDKILVTPRQMKTVAMLCLAECETSPSKNQLAVLKKYIHAILTPLVPPKHNYSFEANFKDADTGSEERIETKAFKVTASRKPVVDMIDSFLRLREFKRLNQAELNDTQKYGDLCSLVLESMPGLGKTELLKAMMDARAINEADIHSTEARDNVFYRIPVSLSFKQKERILRKAFNEGNVVIIDEINSSPMIERLVNALLSGATPEGERPAKPGFLLLGTQNPVSMGARISQTEAQNKRLVKMELPKYPDEEMMEILLHKGIPEQHAEAMMAAFKLQEDIARSKNMSIPNFRDLQRAADKSIAAGIISVQNNIATQMARHEQSPETVIENNAEEQQIKELLTKIFNDENYWRSKTWRDPLPTTVLRMKTAMENGQDLSAINSIARNAAGSNGFIRFFHHRHEDTHRFYSLFLTDTNEKLLENLEEYYHSESTVSGTIEICQSRNS